MNFIDAHSHIWTPDTKTYPLAAGFNRGRMKPLSFTADELMKQAKPVGVNRVVLIQISFYGYNNRFMLETIRKSPKQFVGVALIDQDARRPELEMRKLKKLGVTGFRIYPKNQKQGDWLGSESMHRMWTTAAKENLNMCCLINPTDLTSLDRMCRDFPDTPVVIDHLCRVGAGGPIVEKDVKALCDMARHKNVSVKVSAFYALGKKKAPYNDLSPLIKRVYDAFGPKRLMWASDSPFQVVGGHTYKASIDLVKQGLPFLKKDDKTWLLGKTAERVFFRTNS
jgi:predicted TIM-barrel fold metal-dependent hydrolase